MHDACRSRLKLALLRSFGIAFDSLNWLRSAAGLGDYVPMSDSSWSIAGSEGSMLLEVILYGGGPGVAGTDSLQQSSKSFQVLVHVAEQFLSFKILITSMILERKNNCSY